MLFEDPTRGVGVDTAQWESTPLAHAWTLEFHLCTTDTKGSGAWNVAPVCRVSV